MINKTLTINQVTTTDKKGDMILDTLLILESI